MHGLFQRQKAIGGITLAALGLLLGGAAFAQAPANSEAGKTGGSQSQSGTSLNDVKITLDTEQEDLLDALRSLMKSAKADFVIDDALKEGTVTVHLKDVPFKDALATVIKVSTLPIMYDVKDGIYHFKLRPDTPPEETPPVDPSAPAPPKVYEAKIKLHNIEAGTAARTLNGDYDPPPQPLYFHTYNPAGGGGSISYFGFNNGRVTSDGGYVNPDGTIHRTGGNTLNLLNLLGNLFGHGRR